jgi:hypothetical protein
MNYRWIILTLLSMTTTPSCCLSEQLEFPKLTEASIRFEQSAGTSAHYPNYLIVYLQLKNLHDSNLTWACDSIGDIEFEVIDSSGHPLPKPLIMASIQSNTMSYMIPFGSRLDWRISHGGLTMIGDLEHSYALMVGGNGWLIPKDKIESYSVKVIVRGAPWSKNAEPRGREETVLFDIPLTPIKLNDVETNQMNLRDERPSPR